MRLGVNLMRVGANFGGWGTDRAGGAVEIAQLAERLGYDSVWTAETTGAEAFATLSHIGATVGADHPGLGLGTGVLALQLRTPMLAAMGKTIVREVFQNASP